MSVLSLLRFPDPRLRLPSQDVTCFNSELATLAQDLLDTMRAAPGIGITAAHVGVLQKLTVIDLGDGAGVRLFCNPHIVWSSPETAGHTEGSVSMPDVTEEIVRPKRVRVHYRDMTGEPRELEADGLLSVCLQHEVDQIDGVFWIYRLSRLKRERLIKRYQKL